jgi:amidohydrolase
MSQPQEALLPQINLSDATREIQPRVVAMRHDLHRIPEIGLKEYKTCAYIMDKLAELEIKHDKITETGILGLIEGQADGPTVMLRTDIDALPITEETTHDYVSTHAGMMHACGHDTHIATLLGVAERLHREGIDRGLIKLDFQPGEEGLHGAESMIAAGVLENPKVDYAYGQHIWSYAPTGQILIEEGPVMAAVDTVYVRIIGAGTHAAMPEGGTDPIYAGAQVVTALQSIMTRNVTPLEPGVVTVSQFHGGTAHNVIPEFVDLTMSVRVFNDETHALIERRIHEIIEGVAAALGCRTEINYVHEHQPTVNNPAVAQVVREEAIAIVGEENVLATQKVMGAEDFGDYARLVPAAFAFVGARNETKDCVYPHHHPKFNVDEDAFAIAAELMYRVAHRLLAR